MKNYINIFALIITTVLSSCSENFKYNNQAIVIEHSNDISAIKSLPQDTSYINYSIEDDTISCLYLEDSHELTDSTPIFYMYKKSFVTDSVFYLFNQKCKFVGYKEYNLDNGVEIVKKYYYDRPNSADEELDIFYTDEFGIIMTYNMPWGGINLFKVCEKSNRLIEKLLNDKSGFVFLHHQKNQNHHYKYTCATAKKTKRA